MPSLRRASPPLSARLAGTPQGRGQRRPARQSPLSSARGGRCTQNHQKTSQNLALTNAQTSRDSSAMKIITEHTVSVSPVETTTSTAPAHAGLLCGKAEAEPQRRRTSLLATFRFSTFTFPITTFFANLLAARCIAAWQVPRARKRGDFLCDEDVQFGARAGVD